MFALKAAVGCALLPRDEASASTEVASYRPDFSSMGIDPMPVGTAKQVARVKRVKASRKA